VFISRDQGIGSAMTSCPVPRRCAWGRRNRGPGTAFENGSGAAGVRAQGGALVRYLASAAMLFNTNLGQLRRAGRGFGADQARTFSVWVCLRWDSSGKLKRPPGRAPRSAATWSRTWIRLRAAIANRSCHQGSPRSSGRWRARCRSRNTPPVHAAGTPPGGAIDDVAQVRDPGE